MLRNLLMKNRSYRSFDSSVSVSKETLVDLVDNIRYTPSTRNAQALRFRLCYEKEECADVLALTKWAGALPERHFPPIGHEPTAYIVVCAEQDIFTRDVGIAAQTIMLSATEIGLGGCMIGSFDQEKISQLLNIPAKLKPRLILALGKPDESVILEEAKENNLTYYRDENDIHHVPKLKIDDLII